MKTAKERSKLSPIKRRILEMISPPPLDRPMGNTAAPASTLAAPPSGASGTGFLSNTKRDNTCLQ